MDTIQSFQIERVTGALLGLAIGDALGTTLEFKPKDTYQPLTDMIGGGSFHLQAGQWTDDTAMMLCLADSLVGKGRIDLRDQIERYIRWYRHGENSCTGTCFDIGMTVRSALSRYESNAIPEAGSSSPNNAGNGSLMRLAPVAVFFAHDSEEVAMEAAKLSSITTHGESRCMQACELMALLLHRIFNTKSLPSKDAFLAKVLNDYLALRPDSHADVRLIASGKFVEKSRDEIHGSGYVIASLEAALWCFTHSESFEEGVLLAANLGEDADTTAAIFGQLAGAFYGRRNLPSQWKRIVAWESRLEQTALWLIQRPSNKNIQGFIDTIRAHLEQKDERIPLYSLAYDYGLVPEQVDYEAPFENISIDTLEEFDTWIEQVSLIDCLCWLIRLVRMERFFDGIIAENIRLGSVDKWLKRVETLIEAN